MTPVDENLAAKAAEVIDLCGLKCPEPLMVLRNRVREMPPGARVYVVATDPSTERDFASFCRFLGHVMEHASRSEDGHWHFLIQKGGAA